MEVRAQSMMRALLLGAFVLAAPSGACGGGVNGRPANRGGNGGSSDSGGGAGNRGGNGGSQNGGGGGTDSCNVLPCGGDLIGTWRAGTLCVNEPRYSDQFSQGEPAACQLRYVSSVATGTVVFNANGTYTSSLMVDETRVLPRPPECTAGRTCEMEQARLSQMVGTTSTQSVSCAPDGSGQCTCTLVFRNPFEPESSGTFTTADMKLMVVGTNGSSSPDHSYCVQGASVHFMAVDRTNQIFSDLVLTKD
jgi:hypothetical protein